MILFIVNIRCNWREGRVERDSNVCPDHRSHTSITFNIIFCSNNSDRNRNFGGGKCLQSRLCGTERPIQPDTTPAPSM